MRNLSILVVCVTVLSCVSAQVEAIPYAVYDLYPPGASSSTKASINDLGETVAIAPTETGEYRMFFYDPVTRATYEATHLPTYRDVNARDVNNNRQVAGHDAENRAIVWDRDYGLTGIGSDWTDAVSVNQIGAVVGSGRIAPAYQRAFYWTRPTGARDIGTLGGTESAATGVNNLSQVVGWSRVQSGDRHAFIWSPGGAMRDLGTLGGRESIAYGINNRGEVVGITDDGYTQSVFIWDSLNGMRSAFALPAYNTYTPRAINDSGWIVGYGLSFGGFIYDPAGGVEFIAGAHMYDINNAGQIPGAIYEGGTGPRYVLWNPIPEPSSLLALAAGIGGMGFLIRRWR